MEATIKEDPAGGYAVYGIFRFVCELDCIRCLDVFEIEIEKSFNVKVKRVFSSGKHEIELTREDLDTYPLEGENIDLFELIAGELYMSIPDYPLCDDDCKGLCQECGANLNIKSCSCEKRTQRKSDMSMKKGVGNGCT